MNKKAMVFLGSILVLILVTVGFIIFVQLRAKNANNTQLTSTQPNPQPNPAPQPSPNPTPNPAPAPQPAQNNGKPVKLTDSAATSPVLSYDNTLLWYFNDTHLYKVNVKSGLKQEYVLPTNYKIDRAIWPLTGNDFIVQSGTGPDKVFHYYNSQTKTYIDYPLNVKEVDFMPDGQHVAYEWVDAKGVGSLSIANPDLTGHKTVIANMPDKDDIIKIAPTKDRAFLYKADSFNDGKIYYVDLNTGKVVPIKTAADNRVEWGPDGSHFLYTKLDKDGNTKSTQLWLGDIDSVSDVQLTGVNVPVTRVIFDRTGSAIYLAVLREDGNGYRLAYYDAKTFIPTVFFKGDAAKIDPTDLLLTNDSTTMFYKDADGFVYSVPVSH